MLSQAEIDALVGSAAGSVMAAPTGRVKPYDFRRPDKFSKEHLRTLQAIHENVARVATARLSARLRTNVTFTLADTVQVVFDEYVAGMTLPTHLAVLRADGLAGPWLVDFDLGLAHGFLDRLLGGAGHIPATRREPTPIEVPLIERLFAEILPAIVEGWAHLQALEPSVVETSLSPALLRVAAPSHVVAVLTFEVRLAGRTAPVTMCYPHAALEPILPRLSATAWYAQSDRQRTGADRSAIAERLMQVDIPVAAVLGRAEVSVEALAGLRAGDVIRFDDPASRPIAITIQGRPCGTATPGRVGDRIGLRVEAPLQSVES
jgi:flagellar motor switch protein FliM